MKLPKRITLSLIPAALRHAARVGAMLARRNAALLAVFAFATLALAQTRSDTFDAASVVVSEAQLARLADGGCSVRWCGTLTSADGGAQLYKCTDARELSGGANRNTCLNSLDLGANRILNAMNFAVDAGSQ